VSQNPDKYYNIVDSEFFLVFHKRKGRRVFLRWRFFFIPALYARRVKLNTGVGSFSKCSVSEFRFYRIKNVFRRRHVRRFLLWIKNCGVCLLTNRVSRRVCERFFFRTIYNEHGSNINLVWRESIGISRSSKCIRIIHASVGPFTLSQAAKNSLSVLHFAETRALFYAPCPSKERAGEKLISFSPSSSCPFPPIGSVSRQ